MVHHLDASGDAMKTRREIALEAFNNAFVDPDDYSESHEVWLAACRWQNEQDFNAIQESDWPCNSFDCHVGRVAKAVRGLAPEEKK